MKIGVVVLVLVLVMSSGLAGIGPAANIVIVTDDSSDEADYIIPFLKNLYGDDCSVKAISEKSSQVYVDSFSNSKFHVVKNVGHFSFNEQPEEFSVVVGEFLNEIE